MRPVGVDDVLGGGPDGERDGGERCAEYAGCAPAGAAVDGEYLRTSCSPLSSVKALRSAPHVLLLLLSPASETLNLHTMSRSREVPEEILRSHWRADG